MNAAGLRRLPRSIRKHLRERKAALRRALPTDEARRAIEKLVRAVRRGSAGSSAGKRGSNAA